MSLIFVVSSVRSCSVFVTLASPKSILRQFGVNRDETHRAESAPLPFVARASLSLSLSLLKKDDEVVEYVIGSRRYLDHDDEADCVFGFSLIFFFVMIFFSLLLVFVLFCC